MSRRVITVMGLLVVVGLIALLLHSIEWVEEEIDTGFTEEAIRNPYLAAGQFLERFDIASEVAPSVALLDELPPKDHTIVMTRSRRTLSSRRVAAVLEWVAGGGLLLLVAVELDSDEEAGAAPLLTRAGVFVSDVSDSELAAGGSPTESSGADPTTAQDEPLSAADEPSQALPQTVEEALESVLYVTADECLRPDLVADVSELREPRLAAEFWNDRYLRTRGDGRVKATNRDGPQIVSVPWDAGAIVALTSSELWQNRHIHCYDNAHLLRALSRDRKKVWWVFDAEMEPLWLILWRRWPWLLCIAALWLLVWVWREAVRRRAPLTAFAAERRNLLEHTDGVARFLYQQGAQQALLAHLRQQCAVDPTDSIAVERLALKLGVRPERLSWALVEPVASDTQDFTAAVRLLQQLQRIQRRARDESGKL